MPKLSSIILTALLVTATQSAPAHNLLPKPKQMVEHSGETSERFRAVGVVNVDDPTSSSALRRTLSEAGITPLTGSAPTSITITLADSIPGAFRHNLAGYPDEEYILDITPGNVHITAVGPTGVIRASQTLAQLIADTQTQRGEIALPATTITDWPAFKLRGFMHDVGRSFISTDELKHEIDLLSRFKINTFHWHFTENQAWRFAVDKYPQLTADSVTVRFPGSYYTPQQCSEIEAYAAERGITIIPEVDMPGHSAAFTRAFGFDMQDERAMPVLSDVLERLAAAFPLAPYIHIGGDEVPIRVEGFLDSLGVKIHALGKRVVVWNPVMGTKLGDLKEIDMTQMWGTAGRAVDGVPNIDCRYNYANHFDTFADVPGIYLSSVYYVPQGTDNVAGAISAYWNDRKLPDQREIVNQNNMYAAVLATAERAWNGGGNAYIEQGGCNLPDDPEALAEYADWERRFLHHKATTLRGEPIPYTAQTHMSWNIAGPYDNNGDASATFPVETLLKEGRTAEAEAFKSRTVNGAGAYLRHVWGGIVPGLFGNAPLNQTAYAWAVVESPEDDLAADAYIEFQNYSRSEIDLAPQRGMWDRKGSRVWINGQEIPAPMWSDDDTTRPTHEMPLGNENASARRPIPVKLHKGKNIVVLKLPYVATPGIRLNKWMFTFALLDPATGEALEGIKWN